MEPAPKFPNFFECKYFYTFYELIVNFNSHLSFSGLWRKIIQITIIKHENLPDAVVDIVAFHPQFRNDFQTRTPLIKYSIRRLFWLRQLSKHSGQGLTHFQDDKKPDALLWIMWQQLNCGADLSAFAVGPFLRDHVFVAIDALTRSIESLKSSLTVVFVSHVACQAITTRLVSLLLTHDAAWRLLHASERPQKPAQSIFGDLTSAGFSFCRPPLNDCITAIEIRIYHKLADQTHKGMEFAPKQNLHLKDWAKAKVAAPKMFLSTCWVIGIINRCVKVSATQLITENKTRNFFLCFPPWKIYFNRKCFVTLAVDQKIGPPQVCQVK